MLLVVLELPIELVLRGIAGVANVHRACVWGLELTGGSDIRALVVVPIAVSTLAVGPYEAVLACLGSKVWDASFVAEGVTPVGVWTILVRDTEVSTVLRLARV